MNKFRIYFFVLSLFVLTSCFRTEESENSRIRKGVLYLSETNFAQAKVFSLKGEWEFYFKQFIFPNEFDSLETKPIYINEGYWNSITVDDKHLSRKGFATYRMQFFSEKEYLNAYFESGELFTSSKAWINGQLIYEHGIVSRDKETSNPESYKNIYPIRIKKGKNEIVIHVSNYFHRNGGMIIPPRIASDIQILHEKELKIAWTFFIFGILLILAFYHFVIVLSAHSTRMVFYFGSFLVLLALHVSIINEETIRILFPNISWTTILRLEFSVFFVSPPIFAKYIYQFLVNEMNKKVFDYFVYFGVFLAFLTFLLPSYIFSFLIIPYYFVIFSVAIYLFIGLVIAFNRRPHKILFFILSFITILLSIVYDVLIALELIHTERITPFGFFVFSILITIYNVRNLYHLIDENKAIQIKLQHENLTLEKVVSERTNKLSQVHKDLSEINLQKDKFISIISHDLKNPISGIKTAMNFFVLKFDTLDMNMLQQKFKIIHQSVKNIFALLEDLLEWSAVKTNKMEYNPNEFDLGVLILKNVSLVKQMAQQKSIEIVNEVPENKIVFADNKMIDTVLRNLLVNAIKFSYEKSKIIIGSKELEHDEIEVYVKDFGIGISSEKIDSLLKLDKPVSSRGTNKETGTGLGLILCEEFACFHNTHIFIKSKLNEGSTFSFILQKKKKM